MTDMPTFVQLVKEIDALIRERDELKQRLETVDGPTNQKKLTTREVTQIRDLWRSTANTQRDIAEIYDVNPSTVSRIIRGQYWKG
jgi:DNA-binding MarR family transcriptional regulator